MARVIGEGLVKVRPDTSGFARDADRQLGPGFERIVGRLERLAGRLEAVASRAGQRAGQRFADGMERGTSRISSLWPRLFAVGGLAVAGAGMASVAAHAIALTAAVVPAVAAIGTMPAAAAFAAAGLGVLALAGMNVLDSFGQTAGGARASSGAVAAAVEAAQRRITSAQREAVRSQRELNAAIREEQERRQDLALDLEGAQIAEERATRRAEQAEAELAAARAAAKPDPAAIAELELAHREAAHALAEAKERTEDLAAEQAEADRTGVAGSRRVQDAMERQRDATEELAAAKRELGRAGKDAAAGGAAVSKAAQAYAKLAPNARALVDTLRALTPRWMGFQRAVQNEALEDAAADVRGMSDRYLPVLTRRLTGVASAFNLATHQAAGLAMSRRFVTDVDGVLGNTVTTADRLARAVAPILSGLRHVGVIGSQFLPGLAGGALTAAQRFERWTAAARQSGQLRRWIGDGISVLRQLGAIAGNVLGIVVAILRGGGADEGRDMLAGLESGTARLKAFLNSAEGQEKIQRVLGALRGIITGLIAVVPVLVGHAEKLGPAMSQAAGEGGSLRDTLSLTDAVVGFLAGHLDTLIKLLPFLAAGYVVVKGAQTAANLAAVAMLPVKIAEVAANWGLRTSMQAHTAALIQNTAITRAATGAQVAETAATNAGMLARGRAVATLVAQRVATIAGTAATWLATAATTALGVAINFATGPVGLIILGIALLVAGLILAYRKSETFRTIVNAVFAAVAAYVRFMWERVWRPVFEAIGGVIMWVAGLIGWWYSHVTKPTFELIVAVVRWVAARVVESFLGWKMIFQDVQRWVGGAKDFVVDKLTGLVGFVGGLPGKVRRAASGLFDGPVDAVRGGINKIIDMWNRLDLSLSVKVPDWVPGFGGKEFRIPDLFPDIPRLADGGVARARPGGMLAQIAEGGQDEVVAPLSTLAAMLRDAVREALGDRHGIHVEQLIVKAFSDRFSLRQVQEELAMHAVA